VQRTAAQTTKPTPPPNATEPAPPPKATEKDEPDERSVKEVGGRLVVDGETILGVETELLGSLIAGLGISAGYAWNRTEVTRDAAGFVGRALPNAPRHKANVWARYRFNEGAICFRPSRWAEYQSTAGVPPKCREGARIRARAGSNQAAQPCSTNLSSAER
jgi:outer membrane receptor protein involved in Fe transport